ncbi:MAG: hypothetical protein ACE5GO_05915 [Anaerolineales bacterium]
MNESTQKQGGPKAALFLYGFQANYQVICQPTFDAGEELRPGFGVGLVVQMGTWFFYVLTPSPRSSPESGKRCGLVSHAPSGASETPRPGR